MSAFKASADRIRLGSFRLMLERQGIKRNRKKLYRLYKQERLTVRKRGGRKRALGTRAPMTIPQGRKADTLVNGRRFRILALVDDFTRERLGLALTGWRVVRELDRIAELVAIQRHRAELERDLALATRPRCRMALHCPGASRCRMASSRASTAVGALPMKVARGTFRVESLTVLDETERGLSN
jgi:hypothetical protein